MVMAYSMQILTVFALHSDGFEDSISLAKCKAQN